MSDDRAGLRALVEKLPGQQVLVLGDVMLDEVLWGEVRRISPEAPVPVVELLKQTWMPGGAANNAANAVACGSTAVIGGVVGDDPEGERLRALLTERGVDVSGLFSENGRPTTRKTRIVAHGQQVVRLDRERKKEISAATEERIVTWIRRNVAIVGACILSDYGKGVVTPRIAQALIAAANEAGRPVVVDPKGRDYTRYRGAAVVAPNLREAEEVAGIEVRDEPALLQVANRLREVLPGSAILVTRGGEGMSLFVADQPPVHVRSHAAAVFDVTGAGDTVITTLALALAAGGSLPEAIALANVAAGIVVGKVGTATVSLDELRAKL